MFLKNFYKCIAVVAFFGIWELISRENWVNPIIVPPFTDVCGNIFNLFMNGNFINHLAISLKRALFGLIIAVLAGIPLGLLLGGWFMNI
ncbi:MAG TPA: ABC transporter permease, partial [Clostridia bacterium]